MNKQNESKQMLGDFLRGLSVVLIVAFIIFVAFWTKSHPEVLIVRMLRLISVVVFILMGTVYSLFSIAAILIAIGSFIRKLKVSE